MNRRTTAITLIAGALIAGTPAFAAGRPAPDPPPRHLAAAGRDAALADLVAAYRTAPLPEKRRIHSEITLIVHHRAEGWTI